MSCDVGFLSHPLRQLTGGEDAEFSDFMSKRDDPGDFLLALGRCVSGRVNVDRG